MVPYIFLVSGLFPHLRLARRKQIQLAPDLNVTAPCDLSAPSLSRRVLHSFSIAVYLGTLRNCLGMCLIFLTVLDGVLSEELSHPV